MQFNRLLLSIGLASAFGMLAQDFRASISGRVTDPSGAVLPATRATVINTSTGVASPTTTNGDGVYSLRYLIPGTYQIRVEANGFKVAIRDQIRLQVSDQMTLDISLEVGVSSETIKVTGEGPH
jgi:hypothetical protein